MDAQSWVAIAAILVTGFVSLVTAIVTLVTGFALPLVLDWQRAKREEAAIEREKATAELDGIHKVTNDLLGHLAHFRHWEVNDIEASCGRPAQEAYSTLRAKHYAWEQVVRPRLKDEDKERVTDLRRKFEDIHTPNSIHRDVSKLSEEILSLTYIAQDTQCHEG